MNQRDDFFYQAVLYAKEKNYSAARSMLRNLLFQYPDDIEGLLLYSIVAPNKEIAIKALKQVLLIDPDNEIAFNKLANLKRATPKSIPAPTVPVPAPSPVPFPAQTPKISSPSPTPTPIKQHVIAAKAPEEIIKREKLEESKKIEATASFNAKKHRRRRIATQAILLSLFILAFLCASAAALQKFLVTFFAAGA